VSELLPSLSAAVKRKLGHYVYVYVNPLDQRVFYVGKGRGGRVLAHAKGHGNDRTSRLISRIRKAGLEPQVDLVAHALPDEASALRIEAAVIDVIGRDHLTNEVGGWGSVLFGRQPLRELVDVYSRRPARIREPAILIRLAKLYRPDLTPLELYDATRGSWVVGPRRSRARLAFAIHESIVREVYQIEAWFPAGSTFSGRGHTVRVPDRWEFVGRLAPEPLRKRYLGRYVGHYLKRGAQNPIAYVNVVT
jgi:hypothetical protein